MPGVAFFAIGVFCSSVVGVAVYFATRLFSSSIVAGAVSGSSPVTSFMALAVLALTNASEDPLAASLCDAVVVGSFDALLVELDLLEPHAAIPAATASSVNRDAITFSGDFRKVSSLETRSSE